METETQREGVVYLEKFTSRKDKGHGVGIEDTPDSLSVWMGRYLELAVVGIRSRAVAEKAALHLGRFVEFFGGAYGHARVSGVGRRTMQAWQRPLVDGELASSTVNNHLVSLSAFTTWVDTQAPRLFPAGDPAKWIKEMRLPPLEPRALSERPVPRLDKLRSTLPRSQESTARGGCAGLTRKSRSSERPPPVSPFVATLVRQGISTLKQALHSPAPFSSASSLFRSNSRR